MNDIAMGIQLMEYGLSGVFLVLILFYFVIKILMKIMPYRPKNIEEP